MEKALRKIISGEKGQTFVIVLGFLVLGSLTLTPLLVHMTTGLGSGQIFMKKIELDYAADAGLEDALWKSNNEDIPLDPGDYTTEYNYNLTEDINEKDVSVTIKQIWPLTGLETDEFGTTAPECLLITGGIIDVGEGEYKVQMSYDGSEGDLPIDRVAVWLPPGYEYVGSSSSGITTDDPTTSNWRGGTVLTWNFDPEVNFADLPVPDPPGGGFTPGTEYPATRKLYFNTTPVGDRAGGSYCWVRTTNADLYLAWETDCFIYQIDSTATDAASGNSVTVSGYTYFSEGGALGGCGYQMQGNYRAIGQTLMEDVDTDWTRETFVDQSSANITDIPTDAEVQLAYLYWSGWREYQGTQEADRYVGLKVDGYSVYFDEQGDPQQGELPTDPETEILRPNENGSSTQCSRQGSNRNYRCVDEAVADDSATYVYAQGGAVELDTYDLYNRSQGTGTINSVTIYARAQAYNYGACDNMSMQIALRTGSTTFYGDMITLVGNGGWSNYSANWTLNPDTGLPWTWPEIDALEAGIKLYDEGDGSPQCTQVYVEVNYNPLFQGVEATRWWLLDNDSPNYSYSCFCDVTELVKLITTDGNAAYTIAGVSGNTMSQHSYAGWSLIIFYSSPSELAHQFFLYDYFLYATSGSSHTFEIEGFEAPADAEATLTCFVGEGDEHYEYDYLDFNDYPLSDATNPENNVWNGKSSGLGGQFIDGVDLDTFNVSAPMVNPGDTSAEVSLSTDIDCWNLIYTILSFRSEYGGLTPNSCGIITYTYGN
jgi:hypothetical protein